MPNRRACVGCSPPRMISSASSGGLAKLPALERFHDDHGDALAVAIDQAVAGGLDAGVHIVVLDLGHVPVIVVDDLFEDGEGVVEGEADVADPALSLGLLHLFDQPQPSSPSPRPPAFMAWKR